LDKKKLHINETGGKTYPEPDVPVEDAWENMKQLLQHAPAATSAQSKFSGLKGKLFIAGAGAAVVAIVTLITYMVPGKKEKPAATQVIPDRDSTSKSDTLHDGTIAYLNNRTFEFSNTPFKEAAGFIEKAYGVKIIIENDKLDHCKITTRFDNKSLEEILDILGYTLAFEYSIDKNKNQVIISGDGCN
jgi:hypothetical protein